MSVGNGRSGRCARERSARVFAGRRYRGEEKSRTPPWTIASASLTFCTQTPTATQSSTCFSAMIGHLWVWREGRALKRAPAIRSEERRRLRSEGRRDDTSEAGGGRPRRAALRYRGGGAWVSWQVLLKCAARLAQPARNCNPAFCARGPLPATLILPLLHQDRKRS